MSYAQLSMLLTTRKLTSPELKALGTTPITLLDAPTDGSSIVVIAAWTKTSAGTVPYQSGDPNTGIGGNVLRYAGTGAGADPNLLPIANDSTMLQFTAAYFTPSIIGYEGGAVCANPVNTAVEIAYTGEPANMMDGDAEQTWIVMFTYLPPGTF